MDLELTSRTVVVSRAVGAVGLLNPLLSDAAVSVFGRNIARSVFAWQSLPNERARVTFHDDRGLESFVSTLDTSLFCVRREFSYRTVVLRYLPVELSSDAVLKVLADFGEVISHTMCVSRGVFNGTREVGMKLRRHLPSHIFVLSYRGVVSYDQQPRTCFICNSVKHLRRECPDRVSARPSPQTKTSTYASVLQDPLSPVTSTTASSVSSPDTSPSADTRAIQSSSGDRSARIPPVAPPSSVDLVPTNSTTSPHADTRAVKPSSGDRSARIPPVAPPSLFVESVPSTIASSVPSTITSPYADARALRPTSDDRRARNPPPAPQPLSVPMFYKPGSPEYFRELRDLEENRKMKQSRAEAMALHNRMQKKHCY